MGFGAHDGGFGGNHKKDLGGAGKNMEIVELKGCIRALKKQLLE